MKDELLQILAPHGQHHLLAFWDSLNLAQQQKLAAQVHAIDWNLFNKLRCVHSGQGKVAETSADYWRQRARKSQPPQAIILGEEPQGFTRAEARQRGEQALAAGKIGMILVAGGLGTRLGSDSPKGMYPIGPISQRCLFQVIIDRMLAISQRYGVSIPLYIMTSPATHESTAAFLEKHGRFGLSAHNLQLFEQGTMYAVDRQSFQILLASRDEIFTGPDGHGGMLGALERHGVLAAARQRGIEQFFFGQIDNPLLTVCDAELIGAHLLSKAEITTQVVAKTDPTEKVGVVVECEGRTQIIEYVDLPSDAAQERLPDGRLKFWAGNIAVHVFDRMFLERAVARTDSLPFHTSEKKVPYIDAKGALIQPTSPNATRFERFIFDLLPQAHNTLTVEVAKANAFAPVKNDDTAKSDTPTLAKQAIVAQASELLREAGVKVRDGVIVEINPRWALTADDVRTKLPPNTIIQTPTYFS